MDWFVKKIVEHVTDEIPAPLRSQIPDNIEQVVKKEIIKDLAQKGQAVDDFVKSPLPLAKPKTKSPYKHVPGMTPHESILLSATMLDLKDSSTSVLQGLCQRADGKWDYAEIDLNDHYGNKLGKFESEGSGFKHTGRNFKLDAKDTSVLFQGELARPEGGYVAAEVELSICIVVKGAKFVFERHDGFWDRDGWLALNTEGLPVIGFITASIQNITDNEACGDHARRALANCSNSSIVTVAAVVGGFLPGGPAAAGLLAGLATPFALMAESQWADTIDDPRLRDEFEEATIGSAVVEGLTNMLGAAAGGYAGKYVGQWLGKYGKTLVGKAVAKAGSNAASKGAKAGSKAGQNAIDAASEAAAILLVQKIAEVMKGDDSYMKEWVEAQERAKQQRGK